MWALATSMPIHLLRFNDLINFVRASTKITAAHRTEYVYIAYDFMMNAEGETNRT